MGYSYIAGILGEGGGRRQSMAIHLRHNCYPPVPNEWIDIALDAVDFVAKGEGDAMLANPVRPGFIHSADTIVHNLRLAAFVDANSEI